MLIGRSVQVGPFTGDLHIGLVGEPPVPWSVTARPRGVDELAGEALYPPVDGDVIDGDTALGQQLPDISVGQSIPQVPADRDRDHLPWNRKPAKTEDEDEPDDITAPVSRPPRSTNATVPVSCPDGPPFRDLLLA